MLKKVFGAVSLAAAIVVGVLWANPGAGVELKVGDPAPDFNLPGTDGKTYSLAGLRGRAVVLAWFPKAFTAG